MSSYLVGAKLVKRLVADASGLGWYEAKLGADLFRPGQEVAAFDFVRAHFSSYHALPDPKTLEAKFPDLSTLDAPEPAAYYLDLVENRYAYELIAATDLKSQEILKADQGKVLEAEEVHREMIRLLVRQRTRRKVVDAGAEIPEYVLQHYHPEEKDSAFFGWPYLDDRGGIGEGDVATFLGRPAMGKTYKMLYVAMHNWMVRGKNTLFVDLEVGKLQIAQRIAAMHAHTNVGQLYVGGYSTHTFEAFVKGLEGMSDHKAKLYVVEGTMAETVDEVFDLAAVLDCEAVVIDGAYMLECPEKKLGVWERHAWNVKRTKKRSAEDRRKSFMSFQFNKVVNEKASKGADGKKKGKVDAGDAYGGDSVAHYSSVVLGIFQDEGVETLERRRLDLLKGRKGEVGQFFIRWDFSTMDFSQVPDSELEGQELAYL